MFLYLSLASHGFLGGDFEALFPRLVTSLTQDPGAELLFYGILEFERGLSIIIAGPLGGVLVRMGKANGVVEKVLYGRVGIFVGTVFLIVPIGGLGWVLRSRKLDENHEKALYEMVEQVES